MKSLSVSCAVIVENQKILCAQRSASMKMPLKWEFPGGKIEKGETPENCLKREIAEELGLEIDVVKPLPSLSHNYSVNFRIHLSPFFCKRLSGDIILAEHAKVAWLTLEELHTLDWAEADVPVVAFLQENPELLKEVFCT